MKKAPHKDGARNTSRKRYSSSFVLNSSNVDIDSNTAIGVGVLARKPHSVVNDAEGYIALCNIDTWCFKDPAGKSFLAPVLAFDSMINFLDVMNVGDPLIFEGEATTYRELWGKGHDGPVLCLTDVGHIRGQAGVLQ